MFAQGNRRILGPHPDNFAIVSLDWARWLTNATKMNCTYINLWSNDWFKQRYMKKSRVAGTGLGGTNSTPVAMA